MRVLVQGGGPVDLTQKDFVAAGGEGSVYAKGTTAYKVYTDPTRMLPVGKITELASLTDPNVIRPDKVLLDPKGTNPLGYTMRFITDSMPLCQVLTRAFREREGLDHAKMLKLVQTFQKLVAGVHRSGVLIVDLNEMNFLVNRAFTEVYGIDVDSYQTAHYPATAIMPSVRDWTVQGHGFTQESDWFSFACVAYQMFTGIHPYKGKHPTIQGLEDRMKASVSVFDPSVSVPKVVYPVDVIPPGYRAWFKAVLQDGKRLPPPSDPVSFVAAAIVARVITSGVSLDISEIASFPDAILGYAEHGGHTLVGLKSGVWFDGRPVRGYTPVRAVGFSPKMGHAVIAWIEGDSLRLYDATLGKDVASSLRADDVMGYAGRIYVRLSDEVLEVQLNDASGGIIATAQVRTSVLPHAAHLHDGVVLQDLLGSMFVSVYPRAGIGYQVRVPELDAYKVFDARYDNRVLMVVGTPKKGKGGYDRLTFVFDEDHGSYKLTSALKDITPAGLNFIVLDSGTTVHITEEEKLEVWNVKAPGNVRVVDDKAIGGDMRLVKHGGRVAFIRGDKVSTMRMK